MAPNQGTYHATSGRHAALRFSKSGVKAIKAAYSRHYKWNRSAENKRKAISEAINCLPSDLSEGSVSAGPE
jgi:hypothetical protein